MTENNRLHLSRLILIIVCAAVFSGCAAVKQPLTGLVPGRSVTTLQSSVSLSASSGERSSAGRGYLVYQAPDMYHLLILSPFGQTMLEAFGESDRFTCVIPSKQVAFTGLLSELPEQSALKSLQLFQWVMAPSPLPLPGPLRQKVEIAGTAYHYDEIGMLERKVAPSGDQASYQGYRSLDGVPFPETIEIHSAAGGEVRIVFDEPQLNAPVEASSLKPDLSGMAVYPLAEFKVM
ncbi:outer membrane lipoprotein LolB [Geomonas nitrogeniifigens]|uniref:Outer membrane lipoprotein LolB n=1 Tax=Geomonas diazotrophica TaxID=2843197 RepID=A0ABX8JP15_9BACT|nr:lipoprotein insertase outer membrane protein LolB [Geomonas nitrogeniifigens]QWV99419.1 outer membrane lipoprotein LolB [Geomonas nitrogeniifigens]QXE88595.1 outer membrane lipoprotein LolB [Geomonas nitrogeniifigens]